MSAPRKPVEPPNEVYLCGPFGGAKLVGHNPPLCSECWWYQEKYGTIFGCAIQRKFLPEARYGYSIPGPFGGERPLKDGEVAPGTKCGPEGKLFEPKRPWWRRWRGKR